MLHERQPSNRPPRLRLLVIATKIATVQRALVALRPFYDVELVPDLKSCSRRLKGDSAFDALLLDSDALATSCASAYQALSESFPTLATRAVFLCGTPAEAERLQRHGIATAPPGCALAELLRALRGVDNNYFS